MEVQGVNFQKKQELIERVFQAPGEVMDKATVVSADAPMPSRWTLRTLRASLDWLNGYTLSGVYRVPAYCGLRIRLRRVQYGPDPEYAEKVLHLCSCLQQTVRARDKQVRVFLDEMGILTGLKMGVFGHKCPREVFRWQVVREIISNGGSLVH